MASRALAERPDTDFSPVENPVSERQATPLVDRRRLDSRCDRGRADPGRGSSSAVPDPSRSQLGMGNRSRTKVGVTFSGSRFEPRS